MPALAADCAARTASRPLVDFPSVSSTIAAGGGCWFLPPCDFGFVRSAVTAVAVGSPPSGGPRSGLVSFFLAAPRLLPFLLPRPLWGLVFGVPPPLVPPGTRV